MDLLSIVIALLLSMMMAQAVLVARVDDYGSACISSSKVSVPVALNNTCWEFTPSSEFNFNCASQKIAFSPENNCTTSGTQLAFDCVSQAGQLAIGYSCQDYPDQDVIVMTLAKSGCNVNDENDTSVANITLSFAQIVNTCLPFPPTPGAPISAFNTRGNFYRVGVKEDGTVTYSQYTGSSAATACLGSPFAQYIGKLGKCVAFNGASSGRRQLAIDANALVFQAAVHGAKINTDNSTNTPSGNPSGSPTGGGNSAGKIGVDLLVTISTTLVITIAELMM